MAVILEEKRNIAGVVNLVSWLVILAVIAIAAYYVFIKKPEIIDERVPPQFESIEQISHIDLDPEAITASPQFLRLRQHVPPPQVFSENYGKENPFVPFTELLEKELLRGAGR